MRLFFDGGSIVATLTCEMARAFFLTAEVIEEKNGRKKILQKNGAKCLLDSSSLNRCHFKNKRPFIPNFLCCQNSFLWVRSYYSIEPFKSLQNCPGNLPSFYLFPPFLSKLLFLLLLLSKLSAKKDDNPYFEEKFPPSGQKCCQELDGKKSETFLLFCRK